jgi:hypothetical protein
MAAEIELETHVTGNSRFKPGHLFGKRIPSGSLPEFVPEGFENTSRKSKANFLFEL